MTVTEKQTLKLELLQSIINMDDEDSLRQVFGFIKRLDDEYPCMHTLEEVQSSIDEAIELRKAGDFSRFTSHEELKKRHRI